MVRWESALKWIPATQIPHLKKHWLHVNFYLSIFERSNLQNHCQFSFLKLRQSLFILYKYCFILRNFTNNDNIFFGSILFKVNAQHCLGHSKITRATHKFLALINNSSDFQLPSKTWQRPLILSVRQLEGIEKVLQWL
jgi:hypothetical protein